MTRRNSNGGTCIYLAPPSSALSVIPSFEINRYYSLVSSSFGHTNMFSSLDESYTLLLSMRPQISFSRNAGDLKALPKPDNDDRVAQAERLLHQAIRKPWKSPPRSRFKALSPFSRVKLPYIYRYGMNSYPEPPSPMTGKPQNAMALSTEPLEQRRGIDPMNVQAISSTQPPQTSNSKTWQSRVTPDKTSILFSGSPLEYRATRELRFGYIC